MKPFSYSNWRSVPENIYHQTIADAEKFHTQLSEIGEAITNRTYTLINWWIAIVVVLVNSISINQIKSSLFLFSFIGLLLCGFCAFVILRFLISKRDVTTKGLDPRILFDEKYLEHQYHQLENVNEEMKAKYNLYLRIELLSRKIDIESDTNIKRMFWFHIALYSIAISAVIAAYTFSSTII